MLINKASKIYQGLCWKCPFWAYITMPQGRVYREVLWPALVVHSWSHTGRTSLATVTAETHMQSSLQRRAQGPELRKLCRPGWNIQLQVLSVTLLQLRSEFRWQLHQTCHYCLSYCALWPKKEFRKWSMSSHTFFSLNSLYDTEESARNMCVS